MNRVALRNPELCDALADAISEIIGPIVIFPIGVSANPNIIGSLRKDGSPVISVVQFITGDAVTARIINLEINTPTYIHLFHGNGYWFS